MADAAAPPPRSRRVATGVVVPHAPTALQRVVAWVVFLLIRLVAATLRYRWEDRSGDFGATSPGPAIFCAWHNRMALGLIAYYQYLKPRTRSPGLAAMVSASKDGGLLAAILECFQVQPVRGSSSRRGPQALLELTTWAERGYDLAITPDGPRGPAHEFKPGAIVLSQITGKPLLPVSVAASRTWTFKTWDRFELPLPFSRVVIAYGEPVKLPRAMDAQALARMQVEMAGRLLALKEQARQALAEPAQS